jgi:hypothetical protein
MFEKDAEERTLKDHCIHCWLRDAEEEHRCTGFDYCSCYKDWQKGAEFGYNKANEWHYVKDRDLPKNNMQVLVLLENKRLKIAIFMENKFTIWNKDYDTYTKLYNVIAWKEIILPKVEE